MATSKKIQEQYQAIKKALRSFPGGASLKQIETALGLGIEYRTLQRRMAELKDEGIVATSGGARSTIYHLVIKDAANEKEIHAEDETIPLRNESKQILSELSIPEQRRKPVGYNRSFLELYRPNKDSYLSKDEIRKLEKIGQTPMPDQPAGTYAREILNRLLIDLSWNSSRLEGNTYTLLDTERLIELGEVADDKSAMEAQMILNHKDAIEFLVQSTDDIGFNRYTILNLHALLSNNLLPDPAASGRLRRMGVGIKGSVYTPLSVPQQIEEFFDLILNKTEKIKNPFEQAFFIMVHLPYLQPFDDVNKRVSRLAANIPLNRHNLIPLSFVDVPHDLYIRGMLSVYELNKIEVLKDIFLWMYERSAMRYAAVRQSLGEPDPFRLKYREQIRSIVTEIVSGALSQKKASSLIKSMAEPLPAADRAKFIEVVETELLSLHEGNFARYFIRPAEFKAWKEVWKRTVSF